MVLIQLFNSYCKPLLCYGLECCQLIASSYNSRISFAWNSIIWKLFFIKYSNTCINDILRYSGCLPVLIDLDIRKYAFLCKTLTSDNAVLVNLFHLFGKSELSTLSDAYGIQADYSFLTFRSVLHNRYLSLP